MLTRLIIKNFLLISELELDFHAGLSVVTGETGSGKSIIIDALLLLFAISSNTKANFNLAESGTKQQTTIIAAEFDLKQAPTKTPIVEYLQQQDLIDSNNPHTLLCRRQIDLNGKSKFYINGIPVVSNQIKTVAELIVDIHTQHAPITLLKRDIQRNLLDEYAGTTSQVHELGQIFKQLSHLEQILSLAKTNAQNLLNKRQELEQAIAELSSLQLDEQEWENLNHKHKQLTHSNTIHEELLSAINLLSNQYHDFSDNTHSSTTMLENINKISTHLAKISEYLPDAANLDALTSSISIELNELTNMLINTIANLETDPEILAKIEERIETIFTLSRKYHIQPELIPAMLTTWQNELADLVNRTDITQLEQQYQHLTKQYRTLADKISVKRNKSAQSLSKQVTDLLRDLALSGTFHIELKPTNSRKDYGHEDIEYQVSFNQGVPLQPLSQAASGGELSRTALALYLTLSMHNPPELIIFDEIDVGIGGKIAAVVGSMLNKLSSNKQVLCITHQPQTASFGHNHLVVEKLQTADTTHITTNYVRDDLRIKEIARMLGGMNVTETTLSHAREMVNTGSKAG